MIIGKRHLILAALVLALGAAVYLNWQFAPTEEIVDPTADAAEASALESIALYGDGTVSYTDAAAAAEEAAVSAGAKQNAFEKNRKERDEARENALDTLKDIIDDRSVDNAQKTEAVAKSSEIADNMNKESSIELLIKAKGYSDCVAIISDAEINVLVQTGENGLTAADTAVIRDVVVGQMDISPSNIKIIEVK